tara:strand:+ start:126 stop:791 length:666 start_codon:yes stop_codon:yes gene_type:complete
MYNLYTDRKELFEAKIDISGASLEQSECRILVESDDWNLVFKGEINEDGNVKIPIKKLKALFKEGDTGTIKLEVIADDTYFTPWESEFKVNTSKKVTVEVKSNSHDIESDSKDVMVETEVKSQRVNKPTVVNSTKTKVKRPINNKDISKKSLVKENKNRNLNYIKDLSKIFIKENINIHNLHKNKNKVSDIIHEFISKKDIDGISKTFIVEGVVKILSHYE